MSKKPTAEELAQSKAAALHKFQAGVKAGKATESASKIMVDAHQANEKSSFVSMDDEIKNAQKDGILDAPKAKQGMAQKLMKSLVSLFKSLFTLSSKSSEQQAPKGEDAADDGKINYTSFGSMSSSDLMRNMDTGHRAASQAAVADNQGIGAEKHEDDNRSCHM